MEIILPQIVAAGVYNAQLTERTRTSTANRRTTMFEFELPIETGGISYIDKKMHRIQADTVICARPDQMRHTILPFRCYYIHMILNDGALYDAISELPNFLTVADPEKYRVIFAKICECFDTGLSSDEILLQSLVLELVHTLSSEAKKAMAISGVRRSGYDVTERVIEYINENLTADLSLHAIADLAGLSAIHFHNRFKAATGRTLHQYVEERRIKKAVNLLSATDWTLTQIAYECGFSSQSHFSYTFKKKMKMTPREYAKESAKQYAQIE